MIARPDFPAAALPDAGGTDSARARAAGVAFEALILQQFLAGILPEASAAGGVAIEAMAGELAADSPFGIARMLEARGR